MPRLHSLEQHINYWSKWIDRHGREEVARKDLRSHRYMRSHGGLIQALLNAAAAHGWFPLDEGLVIEQTLRHWSRVHLVARLAVLSTLTEIHELVLGPKTEHTAALLAAFTRFYFASRFAATRKPNPKVGAPVRARRRRVCQ